MITIKNKSECCGCSACKQACPKKCISMQEDEEGFLYPIVNIESCIDCGKCEKVCPILHKKESVVPKMVVAAISKNEESRFYSSSGGFFSELSRVFLEHGGIVFGVAFNKDWETEHISIIKVDDIKKLRASKYSQSLIGKSFIEIKDYLEKGVSVLFSGTPCQILGLKNFLHKDYPNLLTVDIVCHSVPSPKVWKSYLNTILDREKEKSENIAAINFRDKKNGWYQYGFSMSFKDGKQIFIRRDKNPFMKGFVKGLFSRPSCQHCPAKKLSSGSDITIGDCWGVGEFCNKMHDNEGTSLVICNSDKGIEWFEKSDIYSCQINYEDALKYNGAIEHSSVPINERNLFFKLFPKYSVSQSVWAAIVTNRFFKFLGK